MEGIWYEDAVFYGIDIRRFQDSNDDGYGDLQGLISRLDYLADLGITALWLLPFLDTPLRDNGYDIQDYFRVDPRVGTLEDLNQLVQEAHRRGIHLVIDLVMNHTSDQHPWFQASRRDPESRYRNYYIWTETIPEETLGGGPIFPGEEDDVWTFDPVANAYYYHRFYHFQPDMRTSNPAVQDELFKVIDFWLSMGVDGFRIDAAPLMIEPKGIEATRMDDPHRLFRELHHYAVQRKADVVLLGEANVPMGQMDEFFGGGSELNMLFNFQLGPHILLAFSRESAMPIADYMNQLLFPPENDQWLNFLRNHDELSVEKMVKEQQEEIFKTFAPEENMRIYGRGLRQRITPIISGDVDGMDREKMELAFSLLFSTPGTPIFMYGDEIGMGSDLSLPGREPVRTPMQWTGEKNAGFSSAGRLIAPVISEGPYGYREVNVASMQRDAASFWHFIKKIIAERKASPEIGLCRVSMVQTEEQDHRILAHCFDPAKESPRTKPQIFFHNLSSQLVSATVQPDPGLLHAPTIQLGRGQISAVKDGRLTVELPPYGYLWIQE